MIRAEVLYDEKRTGLNEQLAAIVSEAGFAGDDVLFTPIPVSNGWAVLVTWYNGTIGVEF
jgi:hypothetical protein